MFLIENVTQILLGACCSCEIPDDFQDIQEKL